jgi:hypothetical protein
MHAIVAKEGIFAPRMSWLMYRFWRLNADLCISVYVYKLDGVG